MDEHTLPNRLHSNSGGGRLHETVGAIIVESLFVVASWAADLMTLVTEEKIFKRKQDVISSGVAGIKSAFVIGVLGLFKGRVGTVE